jgi:hypothetical protein
MSANGNGNAVTSLSDDLITKARAIANRSDELLQLLEDARQKLLDSDHKVEPKRRFKQKPASATKAQKPSQTQQQTQKRSDEVPEGLRLLTTQMSMEGSDRKEIATRLKKEYDVADPEPILKSLGL